MYDVFIDEEKDMGYIGFLVTTNTPALQQILFNVRESNQNYRAEIKFVSVTNASIKVMLSWVNVFFANKYNVAFYYRKWNGKLAQKRNIITKVLLQIRDKMGHRESCVVFMDFENNHKNIDLQTQIRVNSKVTRCYHLDSKSFDMLQLADILLQCAIKKETRSYDRSQYLKVIKRFNKGVTMKKRELKNLLVHHAMKKCLVNLKIRKKVE